MQKCLLSLLLISFGCCGAEHSLAVAHSPDFSDVSLTTPESDSPVPLLHNQQPRCQALVPLVAWIKNVCCFDYEKYPERKNCPKLCAPTCCPSQRLTRLGSITAACSYWVTAATICITAGVTGCACWTQVGLGMSAAGKGAFVGSLLGAPLATNALCSKCPCWYTQEEARNPYTVSWLEPFVCGCCWYSVQ